MTKKQQNIAIAFLVIIVFTFLASYQWHYKTQKTIVALEAAETNIIQLFHRRFNTIINIVEYLSQDVGQKKQLAQMRAFLAGLSQGPSYDLMLIEPQVHELVIEREQQLTAIATEIMKYGAHNRSIVTDRTYKQLAKELFYTGIKIYNEQRILNQEIDYFNHKVAGPFGRIMNKLTFQYQPRLPLGTVITKGVEEEKKYLTLQFANKP